MFTQEKGTCRLITEKERGSPRRQGFPQTEPEAWVPDPAVGMPGQAGLGSLGKWGRSDAGTRDRHDNGSEAQGKGPRGSRGAGEGEAVRRASGRPHAQCSSGAGSPQVSSWPAEDGDDARGITIGYARPSEGWELPPLTRTHASLSFPAGFPWGDLCSGFCLLRLPSPGHLEDGVDSRQEVSLYLPALFTSICAARHSGEVGPGLW